jgi:hypothetical protein
VKQVRGNRPLQESETKQPAGQPNRPWHVSCKGGWLGWGLMAATPPALQRMARAGCEVQHEVGRGWVANPATAACMRTRAHPCYICRNPRQKPKRGPKPTHHSIEPGASPAIRLQFASGTYFSCATCSFP